VHVVPVVHQPALQQGQLVRVVLEDGDTHGSDDNAVILQCKEV
jgi:hypothetical protein